MERHFPYSLDMAKQLAKDRKAARALPAVSATEPYQYREFKPLEADHIVTEPVEGDGVTSFDIHKVSGEGFEFQSSVQIWSRDPISDKDIQTAISFADFLERYRGLPQVLDPASFIPMCPEMIQMGAELQKKIDKAVDTLADALGTEQEAAVIDSIREELGDIVLNLMKMMAELKRKRSE